MIRSLTCMADVAFVTKIGTDLYNAFVRLAVVKGR